MLLLLLVCAAGCFDTADTGAESGMPEKLENLTVMSPAFGYGEEIPGLYTCTGEDRSFAVSWNGTPEGTAGFALVMDDPDAPSGQFTHWIVWNIPPGSGGLPEGIPAVPRLADGSMQGINDFGQTGYGGPCPPRGPAHRYFFRLMAVDRNLDFTAKEIQAGITRKAVLEKIKDHVIAEASLMGKYKRKE